MKSVDEPESPAFSPDGRTIAFAALRGGIGDIFTVDLDTKAGRQPHRRRLRRLRRRPTRPTASSSSTPRASAATRSCSASISTRRRRRSSPSARRTRRRRSSSTTTRIVFSSTATDPAVPLEPEVAKNGNIYNIWTLDLNTGELRQYTDALGGNWSPVVLNEGKTSRIAFVSYYKGEYGIRTLERKEPLHTAASSDFGAPGPIIDFQAPLQHTLVKENERKKGTFEKMFLEGRPPVNVGVTNNGDVFGGTQVSFGDVLGDKQVNLFAASISQYRTLSLVLRQPVAPLPVRAAGLLADAVLLRAARRRLLRSGVRAVHQPRPAIATRTVRGGSAFGIYPFSRYRRVELSGGLVQLNEEYNDPALQAYADAVSAGSCTARRCSATARWCRSAWRSSRRRPSSASSVRSPAARCGWPTTSRRRSATRCRARPSTATRATTCASAAAACWRRASAASRAPATSPTSMYFGGNSELRGYDYLAVRRPEHRVRQRRAALPADRSGAHADRRHRRHPRRVLRRHRRRLVQQPAVDRSRARASRTSTSSSTTTPTSARSPTGVQLDATATGVRSRIRRPASDAGAELRRRGDVDGFRLQDGRASYGIGLETFALGFPIHFDWSWRTMFNKDWEDVVFACATSTRQAC